MLVQVWILLLFVTANFALDYVQEDPCKSYPGVCKPKTECFEGALDKINGQWGCPSSPAGIKCCPSNVRYVQEEPCKSYPGVCKPKSECPQGALDNINGQWGCPSSPAGIKCCPSIEYKQEEPCKSYPGVCQPSNECPGRSLAKIDNQYSCPSSPTGIECCPNGDGNGGNEMAEARPEIDHVVETRPPKIEKPELAGGKKHGPNGGFQFSGDFKIIMTMTLIIYYFMQL
ncbi:uncharacterized protein LOC110861193 isoform X2 [Folsomia candida]|nr:uncharacterized protein LOC110861193 isoform X2 [Folsomia candida]